MSRIWKEWKHGRRLSPAACPWPPASPGASSEPGPAFPPVCCYAGQPQWWQSSPHRRRQAPGHKAGGDQCSLGIERAEFLEVYVH
eukprot:scaffold14630_cov49-Prasinocladus_malaysianus.AAC.1